MKRKAAAALLALVGGLSLSACGSQVDRVSHNLSEEADNFGIERRVVVINTVTDTPLLEVKGRLSIRDIPSDDQLEITIKVAEDRYYKHLTGLPPTVAYVVEDLGGADVSAYQYSITYLPAAIIPLNVEVR